MPQINFYTYLSQTTWTLILFYIFYYCMKQYLLPVIYESIKLKSLTLKETSNNSILSFNTSNYGYNKLIAK